MQNTIPTGQGNVLIRTAQPADAGAYRELRLEALKNHPTAFGSDYEENLQHPDGYWQERLNINDEQEALFLAEHEGRLVGMTGIYRSLSPRHRHQATVWGVYVRDAWRGCRIADVLIGNCLEWARGKGVVIARLGVAATNWPAIRCYERCGFTSYGIEAKALFHEGGYIDEFLMACSLVAA
jgi:ribosomal protein S18 acetylase RimI-like enzyme